MSPDANVELDDLLSAIRPGCRVRASPSQSGVVVERHPHKEEWRVLLDSGTTKNFRHASLESLGETAPCIGEFTIGQRVRLLGLTTDIQLNGRECVLLQPDGSQRGKSRWQVRMLDTQTGWKIPVENMAPVDLGSPHFVARMVSEESQGVTTRWYAPGPEIDGSDTRHKRSSMWRRETS